MRRREFITLLGGAAAVWPLAARAQQQALPIVGFINGASAWEYARNADAFRQGLSETGYVEGRNVLVEYRWAEGHYERLPELAADLIRRQVTVITANTEAVPVAKAAAPTIPIVFAIGGDPVALGFVASLNRPGGNITGVTSLSVEIGPKRLELLHELVPTTTIMAALINPSNPNAEPQSKALEGAAGAIGVQLHLVHASTERDLDTAFASLAQLRAHALVIGVDGFFNSRSEELGRLALRYAVPAIFLRRDFVAAGGLMSYGENITETYRLAGVYAGRIVRGEKPADLPVLQATKFQLMINLKTAKALGLTVPLPLLGRADEVIE
jgi:putative tryptophan/tyrosine transport system substrate-binding protein